MFNVTINSEETYKCIDNLSEISLFKASMALPFFTQKIDLELKRELLALISEIPIIIILSMTESDIDSLINRVNFSKYDLSFGYRLGDDVYKLMDFEELTVQEYGQLSYYLSGENIYAEIPNVLNVIFKRVDSYKGNILYNMISSIYNTNVVPLKIKNYKLSSVQSDNTHLFNKHIDGALALNLVNSYLEWCDKLKSQYTLLWPSVVVIPEEELDEEVEVTASINEPLKLLEKWGIYHIIATISSSLSEREEWRQRTVRELLEYLTYLKILEMTKEKK